MKVLVIGGVAGGASTAARLRRLDETAEIIMFERSGYVSYANCGLPYYVGGAIADPKSLTLQTPERFAARFRIDARVNQVVESIDRAAKRVTVRRLTDGEVYTESYDKLVLSPGAKAILPNLPGIDDPRVFTIRTVEDALRLRAFLKTAKPTSGLVVGAGFVGLEMAENLMRQGVSVRVVEKAPQPLAILDADMATLVSAQLCEQGVALTCGVGVAGFAPNGERLAVTLDDGEQMLCDLVVLSIGVMPDTKLAKEAGLSLGAKGAILVNAHMRTDDPSIYAAGDAVEIVQRVTGQPALIALAGPANKQARVVADNLAGRDAVYGGAQGASVLKVFDQTVAATGINERTALAQGIAYEAVVLPAAASHATYYPDASNMVIKALFDPQTGRVLGAQIVGEQGVDKRIDVFATAIHAGLTSEALVSLDLAYAPPYASAKEPVNVVGAVMENIRNGLVAQWHTLAEPQADETAVLLDVRTPGEYKASHFEGSRNIPLDALRDALGTLDPAKTYYVNCVSGLRSYLACRILTEHGFRCRNLAGGYRFYQLTMGAPDKGEAVVQACGVPLREKPAAAPAALTEDEVKRVKGLGCLRNRGTDAFNVRVITRNGKLTAAELRAVSDAAARFGGGDVAMTTRLTLEIQGVPYEQIEPLREALGQAGLLTGGTGSKVRPVVSCKGTTCVYGLIDTYALSLRIHERFYLGYHDVSLPHKFKIAVGGCPNNCVKPDLNDLGIVGQRVPVFDAAKCRNCKQCQVERKCPVHTATFTADGLKLGEACNHCGRCLTMCPFGAVSSVTTGYRVLLGGRWGKKSAMGQPLPEVFTDEDAVLDLIEKVILLYRERGQTGERFADTVARLGFSEVERALQGDALLRRKREILGKSVTGGATC